MDFLAEIVKPTGLWAKIIFGMESSVGNYILAIIIVTILVKLVLVPFDFVNRLITKKNTRKQAVLQPALEKINNMRQTLKCKTKKPWNYIKERIIAWWELALEC